MEKKLRVLSKKLKEICQKLNPLESSDSVRLQKIAQTKSLRLAVVFLIAFESFLKAL